MRPIPAPGREVPDIRALLDRTESFVRARLESRSCGHDWWHIHRVRAAALRIGASLGADPALVEMAALLHDVADPKLDAFPGEGARALVLSHEYQVTNQEWGFVV